MNITQTEALVTGRRRSADLDRNLVELHVYLVPADKWQKSRRLASTQVMNESISAGFVRVIPELNVHNLRREIMMQVGPEFAKNDFVFLKNVGRNFTQIKVHQEQQLKAKHFAPPFSNDPEIFLLNIKRESRMETTVASYISDDTKSIESGQDSSLALSPPTSAPQIEQRREQQINELSTLILPALSLSPQGQLHTVGVEAVHTEDSGVMSEDEQHGDGAPSSGGRSLGSPNMQLVKMINDSFDSSKADDDEDVDRKDDKREDRFFGETAPALVEAIPNLENHELFHPQENSPSAAVSAEDREETVPASASPPGSQKNSPGRNFAPQISQDGDFSVTFVILEDNDLPLPVAAAPPPAITPVEAAPAEAVKVEQVRMEQVRRDEEEEEEEEAEEPQQFKLFEKQSRSLSRKSNVEDKEADGLMKELREVSKLNREEEARRHVLVNRATDLQNRMRVRKEKKQTALRSQLVVARKSQVPLEQACSQLRLELDAAHRHLLSDLEVKELPLRIKDGPSRKANLKMNAVRLQHEIKDLNRTIGSVKLRLESEIKLRTQVEMEIRQYRSNLSEKKAAVASIKSARFAPIQSRFSAIAKV